MKSLRWMMSYSLVAIVGLALAFTISIQLMSPSKAQEGPASGELPADFLNEVEGSQVPTSSNEPVNSPTQTPPPPAQQPSSPGGNGTFQTPPSPQQVAQPAPPSDGMMMGENYFYDPTGKRDPFKPVGLKALGLAKPVVLEPLQRFELEKLQVIGILWDVRSPRAMVKDPDGVMHTVIKNSKMGRAEGFVAAIREGELVVVETVYEDGKTLKQTRVMELKK